MVILDRMAIAGLAVLAGCYDPTVRDCTVSCASRTDCTGSQICGEDGLCAAPGVAGRCMTSRSDAAVDTPGDAPRVPLRVQITGKGAVVVVDHDTCSSQGPQHGDCTYDITYGVQQSVVAVEISRTEKFTRWATIPCSGQDASCTFTAMARTIVAAEFSSSMEPETR
jgi:hypothetical protein